MSPLYLGGSDPSGLPERLQQVELRDLVRLQELLDCRVGGRSD
jgi:hypothetical protein